MKGVDGDILAVELDAFILNDRLSRKDVKVLNLQSLVLDQENGFKKLEDVYTCLYFLNTSSILNKRFTNSRTGEKELLKKTSTLLSLSNENELSRTKTEKNDFTQKEPSHNIQESHKTRDRNTKLVKKAKRSSVVKRLAFKVKPIKRCDKTPETTKTSRLGWNSTRKSKLDRLSKKQKSRHYSVINNKKSANCITKPVKRLSIKTFKPLNHASRKIAQQEQSMNLYNTPFNPRSVILGQKSKKEKSIYANPRSTLRSASLRKNHKSKLEPKARKFTMNLYMQ